MTLYSVVDDKISIQLKINKTHYNYRNLNQLYCYLSFALY